MKKKSKIIVEMYGRILCIMEKIYRVLNSIKKYESKNINNKFTFY